MKLTRRERWEVTRNVALIVLVIGGLPFVFFYLSWLLFGRPFPLNTSTWPVWAQVAFGLGAGVLIMTVGKLIDRVKSKKQMVRYVRVVVDTDGVELSRWEDRTEMPRQQVDSWIGKLDEGEMGLVRAQAARDRRIREAVES